MQFSGEAFEHGSQALAAADAHGFEAVAGFPSIHFAQQSREDPPAGCADGVAE